MKHYKQARCVGGLTDVMKSNGGAQYYLGERVYYGDIAGTICASIRYNYILPEKKDDKETR